MSTYVKREKEEKQRKKSQVVNQIMFIPVVCLLAIIPLIVRMVYVQPKDGRMNILFGKVNLDDYYSQYKSVGIIAVTVIMILLTYLFIQKEQIKINQYIKCYLISGGILWGMTLFSMLLSDYKEIAIWGVYDRAEGFMIWTCYMIMMFYTLYIVKDEKGYKWIIGSLIFLIMVTTVLGIFQYAGFDLLVKTKFGRLLVIPKEYRTISETLTSDYESHKVLGTLYHYDYVGSFGAMIVPLFSVLTILAKDVKKKILFAVVTLASLFILFGSTSRAGLVGCILALLIGVVIFGKKMIHQWKITLSMGTALVGVLVIFNFMTKGSIFSRIPTLVQDAASLFMPIKEEFNYKDNLPVREIIEEDGKVVFVLQQDELKLSYDESQLKFTDAQDHPVEYTAEISQYTAEDGQNVQTESYTTIDQRYSNISVIKQPINVFTKQEPIDAILVTIDNTGYFYFSLDETGVHALNSFSGENMEYKEAKSIGFKGKERIGSARGYIWSRTLAMLFSKNLIIGNGPDTFVAYFPQEDILAKWWAYGYTNIIVDKPHNLYLQIASNQGVVALIAFLVLVLVYIIESLRLYAFKDKYDKAYQSMGTGIMLAVIGYLGAGFFNDSVVSVAPIFWILLGTGMAVNYMAHHRAN